MIEVENLSKRYGNKLAVDGLNFVVQPGIVTGFLGPNGSGKSTTMRMIAGLDQPSSGRVTVNGGDYRTSAAPMTEASGVRISWLMLARNGALAALACSS